MLYLGQVCKIRLSNEDNTKSYPAVFLGFVANEKNGKDAKVVYLDFEKGNGVLFERNVTVEQIGFIREKNPKSPTGYSIFRGPHSTDMVNEHVRIKIPNGVEETLKKAKLLL